MQTKIFNLNNSSHAPDLIDTELSFEPFFRLIKEKQTTQVAVKAKFYRYILDTFALDANFTNNIRAEELKNHEELLELIFATLSPVILDDKPYLWALSSPVPHQVIYSTNAFYKLSEDRLPEIVKTPTKEEQKATEQKYYNYVYRLILKKLYNLPAAFDGDIFHSYRDPETDLCKYYQINIDTSFIDVEVKGDLPELNTDFINSYLQEGTGLDSLDELLPLSLFKLKGFSVITLNDVTVRHAVDELRNAIVDDNDDEGAVIPQVLQSLKNMTEDRDFEFGVIPFVQLNGQNIYDDQLFSQSVLIGTAKKYGIADKAFYSLTSRFKTNKKAIFFTGGAALAEGEQLFLKVLSQGKVLSFAGIPLFYNKRIAGMLEVYSFKKKNFSENLLLKLEYALPLLSQLVHNNIEHYKLAVDQVIQENFTALQAPVIWKFYEAAWNYLKAQRTSNKTLKMETVCFNDVYPLYGAIDTRDSTIARNAALKQDLQYILTRLTSLFAVIQMPAKPATLKKLTVVANELLKRVKRAVNANEELKINKYLNEQVLPYLQYLAAKDLDIHDQVMECINLVNNDGKGPSFKNRAQLEVSMQMINAAINEYLEKAQPRLQAIYPCYFEKFRTDGVEYDIYIGQSITPKKELTEDILSRVRVWQLTSMIQITQLTHGLQSQMPKRLQTTQLIFINSNTIDITFRNDERRFDVEGAYNIRYEVIKKRIDKVLLKDKSERLTQPGKIALVYFTPPEAEEYAGYIAQLQQQQLLCDDLEYLDLEELQGVKGLKALRVGVVLDS